MEDTNKKKNIMTLVAVITLVVLVAGATYAYFSVGVTNNFGTSTINATAEGMGSVALNGTNASLLMDLSAADMMKGNAGTYFASSTGTTRDANEVLLGTATLVPATDTRKYECTYTLNITHSSKTNGADDIYDVFSDTTKYANKSKDQIYLSVNGKDYDWYNGFPSSVTGKIYVTGGVPAEIKVGMRLINSTSIDQSALAGHDIQINVVVPNNGFSCEIVESSTKIPENGVYMRTSTGTIYYSSLDSTTQNIVNAMLEANGYSGVTYDMLTYGGDEFPSDVLASDGYMYGDYLYQYSSSDFGLLATVLDKTKTSYGELLSEINGLPLTSLSATFSNCTNLIEAPTIPNSVTNMDRTFSGCTSLTSVPTIPNSVTNMGATFQGCRSLTTPPTIGTSVTNMGSTFSGCTSLTSAPTIPNSVIIMFGTFSGCTSLTSAPVIPNSVTNMADTFSGCTSLTSAPTIPNSVTDMSGTFYHCTSLVTPPTIGTSVTDMERTFQGCTSLVNPPTIPNSVTNMWGTFQGCTSLTSAPTIPNSVTNMSSTFSGCTNLVTPPTIGTSVTDMTETFQGCTSLTSAPEIPNSVTNMEQTFEDCRSLTNAPTIPNSVTNMNSTFSFCTSLTGEPVVNANPTNYDYAFNKTQITGIGGTTNLKAELYATK